MSDRIVFEAKEPDGLHRNQPGHVVSMTTATDARLSHTNTWHVPTDFALRGLWVAVTDRLLATCADVESTENSMRVHIRDTAHEQSTQ